MCSEKMPLPRKREVLDVVSAGCKSCDARSVHRHWIRTVKETVHLVTVTSGDFSSSSVVD